MRYLYQNKNEIFNRNRYNGNNIDIALPFGEVALNKEEVLFSLQVKYRKTE